MAGFRHIVILDMLMFLAKKPHMAATMAAGVQYLSMAEVFLGGTKGINSWTIKHGESSTFIYYS